MSRYHVTKDRFDRLPERIIVREDGYMDAYKNYGEPIIDYVYTLGSGTLTAEQIRGVLLLHLPHREYYSIAQTDGWQAIADELNATLWQETCKLEETESYSSECGMVHVLECSNCGRECEHVNGDYEYCPHCLARNELF